MTTETRNTQATDYYADRALRRAARAQYRAERRAARYAGGGAFVGGVALIAFGVIIMLQNMGIVQTCITGGRCSSCCPRLFPLSLPTARFASTADD